MFHFVDTLLIDPCLILKVYMIVTECLRQEAAKSNFADMEMHFSVVKSHRQMVLFAGFLGLRFD